MDNNLAQTAPYTLPPQEMGPSAPPAQSPVPPQRDINQELEEFRQAFPRLYELVCKDSRKIPREVWAKVHQGMTLTQAFQNWLDEQQAQNLLNSHRSTGSMRSAGRNTAVSDPFLRGFYAND